MERETFALVDNLSTVENSDEKWRKNQELFFAPAKCMTICCLIQIGQTLSFNHFLILKQKLRQ